jgi:hypothetical protein
MIAKQSLLQILDAADDADPEDVAIRAALYIALHDIEDGDFAVATGRNTAHTHHSSPRRSFPTPEQAVTARRRPASPAGSSARPWCTRSTAACQSAGKFQ